MEAIVFIVFSGSTKLAAKPTDHRLPPHSPSHVNTFFINGCTVSDLIAVAKSGASNHGGYASAVAYLTNWLRDRGLVTGAQKGSNTGSTKGRGDYLETLQREAGRLRETALRDQLTGALSAGALHEAFTSELAAHHDLPPPAVAVLDLAELRRYGELVKRAGITAE